MNNKQLIINYIDNNINESRDVIIEKISDMVVSDILDEYKPNNYTSIIIAEGTKNDIDAKDIAYTLNKINQNVFYTEMTESL